jgi:hypothetical protein
LLGWLNKGGWDGQYIYLACLEELEVHAQIWSEISQEDATWETESGPFAWNF